MSGEEWQQPEQAARWSQTRRRLVPAAEAETVIVDHVLPPTVTRVLDLGTGDGRLIATILLRWPTAAAVGLDISEVLLDSARTTFDGADRVSLRRHDLMEALPSDLGRFDAVVSGLAIHHLPHDRKRSLFAEAFSSLDPGGVFCMFDVVSSPTRELHARAQAALAFGPEDQHPSDQPARLEDQLLWLREVGFDHVDCFWKWLELAVLAGTKPSGSR
jgi:tRNA (cmo5U34)-methyltransferase